MAPAWRHDVDLESPDLAHRGGLLQRKIQSVSGMADVELVGWIEPTGPRQARPDGRNPPLQPPLSRPLRPRPS
jgi:hypothetical protein